MQKLVFDIKQLCLYEKASREHSRTSCNNKHSAISSLDDSHALRGSVALKKIQTTAPLAIDSEVSSDFKKAKRSNILITGESGTGKEVVARFIHQLSALKDKPFVAVNCGAIPDTLIESELFGHKKGSFTGAIEERKGFFELAHTGTLFLDEIGELSLAVQPKLLRALQEKVIRKVGAVKDQQIDVRLIAATNRDLESMVKEGLFREDLFYRLNVMRFHVPPLRQRKQDILPLVKHFLKQYKKGYHDNDGFLSPSVVQAFEDYNYPGNVRELENAVERMLVLGKDNLQNPNDIACMLRSGGIKGTIQDSEKIKDNTCQSGLMQIPLPEEGINLEKVLNNLEKDVLERALKRVQGRRLEACSLLGLSTRALRYRLQKYKLEQ